MCSDQIRWWARVRTSNWGQGVGVEKLAGSIFLATSEAARAAATTNGYLSTSSTLAAEYDIFRGRCAVPAARCRGEERRAREQRGGHDHEQRDAMQAGGTRSAAVQGAEQRGGQDRPDVAPRLEESGGGTRLAGRSGGVETGLQSEVVERVGQTEDGTDPAERSHPP